MLVTSPILWCKELLTGFLVGKPQLKGHRNPNERLAKDDSYIACMRDNQEHKENFSSQLNNARDQGGQFAANALKGVS